MNLNNNNTNTRMTTGSSTSNQNQNQVSNNNVNKNAANVNFKYDPMTNQVKDVDVKINMDKETAQKLYQENKQYLPTTQQVISGAKATGNFIKETGVIDEAAKALKNNTGGASATTSASSGTAKKAVGDPLSNFFGSKKGKF